MHQSLQIVIKFGREKKKPENKKDVVKDTICAGCNGKIERSVIRRTACCKCFICEECFPSFEICPKECVSTNDDHKNLEIVCIKEREADEDEFPECPICLEGYTAKNARVTE